MTLYPNRDHTVYFENHQKPSLTVNKICSVTGEPLKGAKVQVTYASNDTESGEINDLGYFYKDLPLNSKTVPMYCQFCAN